MMELLIGRERKELTRTVINRISEHTAKNEKCILIVPEQYSYDAERLLCGKLGSCSTLSAEVLSFSRFAERAFSISGASGYRSVDDGGKYLICISAMEYVLPKLKYFASLMNRPETVMDLVRQIEEFKRYGVSWQNLREFSALFDGVFSQKLEELSLIYECYDSVAESGRFDPSDKLDELAELLWENSLFEGVRFYFDGFSDFTVPQFSVIESLLRTGHPADFSFVADLSSAFSAYAISSATIGKLSALCKRYGLEYRTTNVSSERKEYEKALFLLGEENASFRDPSLFRFFRMPSIYEECKRAAEEIKMLVMQGHRYQDITLACSNPSSYIPFIKPIFRRLRIPATLNERYPLSAEPLVQAILSAISAAVNHYETDEMLRFIKSPFSPLDEDESDLLENYVILWGISGKKWECSWDMDPAGYHQTGRELPDLDTLNSLRLRIMKPLSDLREALKKADNCSVMTRAVYDFLRELRISEVISELCEKRASDPQRIQLISQIPELLLKALEQLYSISANIYKRPDEYAGILKSLLSVYSLKNIPACLDAVTFGSFDAVKYKSSKCVVVLGCEEGNFPSNLSNSGILSNHERELLNRNTRDPVCSDCSSGLSREYASIYDLLCNGQEYIAFIWNGENPSYLIGRLFALNGVAAVSNEEAELIFDGVSAAAELMVQSVDADDSIMPDELRTALIDLKEQSGYEPGLLSPEAVRSLYSSPICLSASKIECQASCRFSYFLQYGLNLLKPVKAEVDPALFGTMTHEVLEKCLTALKNAGTLHNCAEEDVKKLSLSFIHEFLNREIPDHFSRDERFRQLLNRNVDEIVRIVQDVADEFRYSDFEPKYFERGFGVHGEAQAIRIRCSGGDAVLNGVVDRVDVFSSQDANYYRVIDYKTGHKEFHYSDLLEGMGMQMFIYLFAMGREREFRDDIQSGVLYIPAKSETLSFGKKPTENEIEAKKTEKKKRSGLILRDENAIRAMEHGDSGFVYLPVIQYKDGSIAGDLVGKEEMPLLRRLVDDKLSGISEEIFSGQISANPWSRGEALSSCSYCQFKGVCRKMNKPDAFRSLKEMSNSEFFEELRGRYGDKTDRSSKSGDL